MRNDIEQPINVLMKLLILPQSSRRLPELVVGALLSSTYARAGNADTPVKTEILAQNTSSWDGTSYKAYPRDQPQITILKVTIPPHITLQWHTHPIPSAGFVLSGELTLETKDGKDDISSRGRP